MPATRSELEQALRHAAEERQVALEIIESVGAKREALLLEDDSDVLILALEGEAAAANLRLERLERIVPELEYRLAKVVDAERIASWERLRDGYVEAGRRHVDALRDIRLDVGAYDQARRAVLGEFPAAAKFLPAFYFVPHGTADALCGQLDALTDIGFDPRPKPVAGLLMTALELEQGGLGGQPGGFPKSGEPDRRVGIRLRLPAEILGIWHPAGAELRVDGLTAEIEVGARRAVLIEEEAT